MVYAMGNKKILLTIPTSKYATARFFIKDFYPINKF